MNTPFIASSKHRFSRSLFRTSSSDTDCILTFSLGLSVPTLRRFCHLRTTIWYDLIPNAQHYYVIMVCPTQWYPTILQCLWLAIWIGYRNASWAWLIKKSVRQIFPICDWADLDLVVNVEHFAQIELKQIRLWSCPLLSSSYVTIITLWCHWWRHHETTIFEVK